MMSLFVLISRLEQIAVLSVGERIVIPTPDQSATVSRLEKYCRQPRPVREEQAIQRRQKTCGKILNSGDRGLAVTFFVYSILSNLVNIFSVFVIYRQKLKHEISVTFVRVRMFHFISNQ